MNHNRRNHPEGPHRPTTDAAHQPQNIFDPLFILLSSLTPENPPNESFRTPSGEGPAFSMVTDEVVNTLSSRIPRTLSQAAPNGTGNQRTDVTLGRNAFSIFNPQKTLSFSGGTNDLFERPHQNVPPSGLHPTGNNNGNFGDSNVNLGQARYGMFTRPDNYWRRPPATVRRTRGRPVIINVDLATDFVDNTAVFRRPNVVRRSNISRSVINPIGYGRVNAETRGFTGTFQGGPIGLLTSRTDDRLTYRGELNDGWGAVGLTVSSNILERSASDLRIDITPGRSSLGGTDGADGSMSFLTDTSIGPFTISEFLGIGVGRTFRPARNYNTGEPNSPQRIGPCQLWPQYIILMILALLFPIGDGNIPQHIIPRPRNPVMETLMEADTESDSD